MRGTGVEGVHTGMDKKEGRRIGIHQQVALTPFAENPPGEPYYLKVTAKKETSIIVVPVGRDISDVMRDGIWRVEMVPNFENFRRMREALHGFIERENCPLRELIANDPGTPEERHRLNLKEKKNHYSDNWNVVRKWKT